MFQKIKTVRNNVFYDDGEFYYVGHVDSTILYKFDRNDKILRELIRDINRYGTLVYNKQNRGYLTFQKSPGRRTLRLSAWLYAKYHGMTIRKVRKNKVCERTSSTGDMRDYTSNNLIQPASGMSYKNRTRTIEIIESCIKITTNDGIVDYFTDMPILREIVTRNDLSLYRNGARLKIRVYEKGTRNDFYAYDLAIACYHGAITSPNNFVAELNKFITTEKNPDTTDHADNNINNNIEANLSLMSNKLNCEKGTLVARFRPPYALFIAYCNNEYRVRIIIKGVSEDTAALLRERTGYDFDAAKIESALNFICPDAESLAKCLNRLADSHFDWSDAEDTPRQNCKNTPDSTYWATDTEKAIRAQELLVNMEREEFVIFQA